MQVIKVKKLGEWNRESLWPGLVEKAAKAANLTPDEKKHLFQLQTTSGLDWTLEKEWRFKGDLSLKGIGCHKIVALTPSVEEARSISERFGVEVTLAAFDHFPSLSRSDSSGKCSDD
jgi:hypothetical protein